MPLRAIINGEDVLAPFLSDEEWERLKFLVKLEDRDVRLPCCGNIAYLRTSKRGLHHFVHKERDVCTSAPETWQHLKAKYDIVLACQAAGYQATTEVAGEGWRADVLATKGNAKIAFEVQWSPQTWEETLERQAKYREAGIRGCWFFKNPPSKYEANREVPLFKVTITEDNSDVVFNPHGYERWNDYYDLKLSLSEFVSALLGYKIRFCDELRSKRLQTIRLVFVEIDCWRCHKPYHVYYISDLKTPCGESLGSGNDSWSDDKEYFAPEIVAMASEFARSSEGQHIKLGPIKKRYSKTVGHNYMSFGCAHCDAICGDFFLHHEIIPEAVYNEDKAPAILEKELTLSTTASVHYEHWCFSKDGEFCCS